MALFHQVKCGRCDRTYSSVRGKCPFCGARRGSGKNVSGDGESTRWQVIVGAVILLAIIAAAIVLISISLKGRGPENSVSVPTATATPGNSDKGGVTTIEGTEPTAVPTATPAPTPTPTPTPPHTPEPVVNSITLNRSDFTLGTIGETYTITATLSPAGTTAEVVWISEDPSICTVDENGVVTAVNHGYTIVSATAGGITKECVVRVSAYATGSTGGSSTGSSSGPASLSHSDVTIHAGNREQFTLSVKNGDGAVSYSSSNTSAATVNSSGVVTAVGKGTATIKVTVGSQTLECIVRVVN